MLQERHGNHELLLQEWIVHITKMMTKYYITPTWEIFKFSCNELIFIDSQPYIIFLNRDIWTKPSTIVIIKIETCQDCQSRDDQVLLWQIFFQQGYTWAFSACAFNHTTVWWEEKQDTLLNMVKVKVACSLLIWSVMVYT